MKFLRIVFVLVMAGAMFLLNGCSNAAADEEKIMQWLKNTYGDNAYSVQKDPEYKHRWIVTLNEYPDVPFHCNVFHDWLALGSPIVQTDFREVFCKNAIEKFEQSHHLDSQYLSYMRPVHFIYSAKAESPEELRVHYDKVIEFITFASEKYPILVEKHLLGVSLHVDGIHLKGTNDKDKWVHIDISEVKNESLFIKPYEDICNELTPQLKTHSDNPNGLIFRSDTGKSFILGSDTFEDCLYKNLVLDGVNGDALKSIVLAPGEESEVYTLKSEDYYNSVKVAFRVKNMTASPCSVFEATLVEAVISNSTEVYIDPAWIEFEDNAQREWIDPYEALGIMAPQTEREKSEGVSYKNSKILFEMAQSFRGIRKVSL